MSTTMNTATWNNTKSWNFETAEAKAAKEEAERIAYAAQRKAAEEARLLARAKLELPILRGITNALQIKSQAGEVVLDQVKLIITVKGISATSWIDIREERDSSSVYSRFRDHRTGKLRVSVGSYGERQSYPQRKDGSFNYEAIADRLLAEVSRVMVRVQAEAARKANAEIVPALRKEYGFKYEYSPNGIVSVEPSSSPSSPVALSFEFKKAVTVERARQIMDALKTLGMME